MHVKTWYYRQYDADLSREVPEEAFGGWASAEIEVEPKRMGLVLMHAWDCGTPEQYPGWFRCCPEIVNSYRVLREVMPRLLTAWRQAGLPLFHVVANAGYYQKYPGYERAVRLAGPEPAAPPRAEPDPVWEQLQRFRAERAFPGAHNLADCARGWEKVQFPKAAEPVGDEGIAKDAHQLTALARDAGVNHLVYTGFNLDWCLLMSAGGMLDMGRRGYVCSAVRDAVTAVENGETARYRGALALGLWRVSIEFGLVFDSADLIAVVSGKG